MENKKDKKITKKSTNNKKSDLTISIKDFSNYTFLQKINVYILFIIYGIFFYIANRKRNNSK